MPRTYHPDAVREAAGLYFSGLTDEDVAAEMRKRGYAKYNPETLRRWAEKNGWSKERARLRAEEAQLLSALDGDRLAAEMLISYVKLRADLEQKRLTGEIEFSEAVTLQLKVDGLIRQMLLSQRGRNGRVDKPALALEVIKLLLEYLAENDPIALEGLTPHIEAVGELIKDKYAEAS